MIKFKLVRPEEKYEDMAYEYIKEFNGKKANGSGSLDTFFKEGKQYSEWLENLKVRENVIPSEEAVPTITLFLTDEEETKIYGMVNIRLALNEKLKNSSGNIGYSIRPSERRKGYNKINLYLALKICKQHGLKEVMLDCDEDNLGSKKTIISLGGKYESKQFIEKYDAIVEKYWINVEESLNKNSKIYEEFIVKGSI